MSLFFPRIDKADYSFQVNLIAKNRDFGPLSRRLNLVSIRKQPRLGVYLVIHHQGWQPFFVVDGRRRRLRIRAVWQMISAASKSPVAAQDRCSSKEFSTEGQVNPYSTFFSM